jgi:hypothetical protein
MHKIPLLLCTALVAFACHCRAVEDFEALSKSPVWQVRYCVSIKFDSPSAASRRALERLSVDEVPQVARQAFVAYSRMFVELDRNIVGKAFARGDFDLVGADLKDRKVFESPDFWIRELNASTDASTRARAVRAIGMCGTPAHATTLSGHLGTTNSYLLIELALAFHRLGDSQRYLDALEAILALPINEAFYYQTYAIDCLLQTDPDRARGAWTRVHERFESSKDCEPGWVYSHIVQEARLP